MNKQDEIHPDSWQMSLTKTLKDIISSCHVEFRHLTLSNAETLRSVIKKDPEITIRTVGAADHIDVDPKNTFNSSLDLSRNFYVALDLNEAIIDITQRLSEVIDSQVASLYRVGLRTVCLASNDLERFPIFPILPNLEEIYLNHNYIKTIQINAMKVSDKSYEDKNDDVVPQPTSWTQTCPKLRLVDFRNNLLDSIPGLYELLDQHQGLQHLSLSSNRLTFHTLSDLPSCPNMKILGLFSNHIDHAVDESPVQGLIRLLKLLVLKYPSLEDLYLIGNPITNNIDHDKYRSTVTSICTTLRYLDGQPLQTNVEVDKIREVLLNSFPPPALEEAGRQPKIVSSSVQAHPDSLPQPSFPAANRMMRKETHEIGGSEELSCSSVSSYQETEHLQTRASTQLKRRSLSRSRDDPNASVRPSYRSQWKERYHSSDSGSAVSQDSSSAPRFNKRSRHQCNRNDSRSVASHPSSSRSEYHPFRRKRARNRSRSSTRKSTSCDRLIGKVPSNSSDSNRVKGGGRKYAYSRKVHHHDGQRTSSIRRSLRSRRSPSVQSSTAFPGPRKRVGNDEILEHSKSKKKKKKKKKKAYPVDEKSESSMHPSISDCWNDLQMGFCDQSVLFNQANGSVIVSRIDGHLIVPVYSIKGDPQEQQPYSTHRSLNPHLLRYRHAIHQVRKLMIQDPRIVWSRFLFRRSLHALMVSITAVEDVQQNDQDDGDSNNHEDNHHDLETGCVFGQRRHLRGSTSPRGVGDDKLGGGLQGLICLEKHPNDSEAARELFCLQANELQRVKAIAGNWILIPKPGIHLRSVIQRPSLAAIAEVGKYHNMKSGLRRDDHTSRINNGYRDRQHVQEWDLKRDADLSAGYQQLETLKIHVLLELQPEAISSAVRNLKLPTGFFSKCYDFGVHKSPIEMSGFGTSIQSREGTLIDVEEFPTSQTTSTFPLDGERSLWCHGGGRLVCDGVVGLLDSITSDLKFGNPKSHLIRLKDFQSSSLSTIPSLVPIVSLSHIARLYEHHLDIDVRHQSLVRSLHHLQENHWAASLVRRGIQYARDGQYAAAIEQYDAALSNVANYVDAFIARGAAKANLGRYSEAILDFDKAMREDPYNENAKRYKEKTVERKLRQQFGSHTSRECQRPSGLNCDQFKALIKEQSDYSTRQQTSHRISSYHGGFPFRKSSPRSHKQHTSEFLLDWREEQKRLQKYNR